MLSPISRLHLDRLSVSFDVPVDLRDEFARWLRDHGRRVESREYGLASTLPNPNGQDSIAFVACRPVRPFVRFARVDFNPSRTPMAPRILSTLLQPFLPPQGWTATRLTRIDIAVDYLVALAELVAFARNRTANLYCGPAGIETMVLGAKRSRRKLVLYDKRAEMQTRNMPVPAHPVTRIEAQIRPLRMSVLDFSTLPNPFSDLVVTQPAPAGGPLKDRLYLTEARRIGLDAVVKQLKRHERARVRALLAAAPVPFVHPQEIFDRDYGSAAEEVVRQLTGEPTLPLRSAHVATPETP